MPFLGKLPSAQASRLNQLLCNGHSPPTYILCIYTRVHTHPQTHHVLCTGLARQSGWLVLSCQPSGNSPCLRGEVIATGSTPFLFNDHTIVLQGCPLHTHFVTRKNIQAW